MITYIVRVNFTKFEFMNGATALSFAELAKTSIIESDADIEIELKAVPMVQQEVDDDF